MMVRVGDVDLNVRDEGAGPAVAMLHGHSLDLRVWDDLAARLIAAGRRVVRWDQRGHGRSESPARGYRFGDHAADGAALLSELGAGPADVVALSKGGGIALEMALRHPDAVRSLVLVGPLLPDRRLSPELVDSFRAFARAVRSEGTQTAVRRLWLHHPLIAPAMATPGARELVEAMTLGFPAGEYLAEERDARDRDWSVPDRLGEIAVPTLVISGEEDIPDFAAMAREAAAAIPGAALEVVPGCGHLVPLLAPETMAGAVLGFLANVSRPGGSTAASRGE